MCFFFLICDSLYFTCFNFLLPLKISVICFCSPQEREHVTEQQTVLRQLEAILSVHKLVKVGHYIDALREVARLPFLPLDPRTPDIATDVFQNLSPNVQACIPDVLRVALTCLDNVTDSDGSLRALRAKVCFSTNKFLRLLLFD